MRGSANAILVSARDKIAVDGRLGRENFAPSKLIVASESHGSNLSFGA
jgi:hypothetical protein